MSAALYAEFRDEEGLRGAVRAMSSRGLELDVFTPYPVVDLEPSLKIARSTLPRWVLAAGLGGALGAYLLQLWCAAISYPLDVGGRPLHSAPAFIPITFESGILAASLMAFVGVLVKARLVRLYDPVFEIDGFERATTDRFWLMVRVTAEVASRRSLLEDELRAVAALRVVYVTTPPMVDEVMS